MVAPVRPTINSFRVKSAIYAENERFKQKKSSKHIFLRPIRRVGLTIRHCVDGCSALSVENLILHLQNACSCGFYELKETHLSVNYRGRAMSH